MAAPCKIWAFGRWEHGEDSAAPHRPTTSWRQVPGKAGAHQVWDVCRDHPTVPPPLQGGDYLQGEGRKKPILPPWWGNPWHTQAHTHTWGRLDHSTGHAYLQAGYTPSLQEGETQVQGPWWWTTEKRSGGEGDRSPRGQIQSQNKKEKMEDGMESKNRTKNCQLSTWERARGSHQHIACSTHQGKVLNTLCPS